MRPLKMRRVPMTWTKKHLSTHNPLETR